MDRIIKNIIDTAKAAAKGAEKAAKAAGSAGVSVGSGNGEKTGKGGKKVTKQDSIDSAKKAANDSAKAARALAGVKESRKTILRLTESDLHQIVKEATFRIINNMKKTK